ncbi:hypothetical protein [Bacillus alveayuensis]|uniref:hypothetical protein n=1 Tax=Aeribacillus alveayuensis TaxID=279215 RepID=UPI000A7B5EFE|nr:hypothetical protein [Bacillus alveayuensis]
MDHRTSSRTGTPNEKCEHGETNYGDSSHYARNEPSKDEITEYEIMRDLLEPFEDWIK